jgi:hypothetical protein
MLREVSDILETFAPRRHPQFPQNRTLRMFRLRLMARSRWRFGRVKIQISIGWGFTNSKSKTLRSIKP